MSEARGAVSTRGAPASWPRVFDGGDVPVPAARPVRRRRRFRGMAVGALVIMISLVAGAAFGLARVDAAADRDQAADVLEQWTTAHAELTGLLREARSALGEADDDGVPAAVLGDLQAQVSAAEKVLTSHGPPAGVDEGGGSAAVRTAAAAALLALTGASDDLTGALGQLEPSIRSWQLDEALAALDAGTDELRDAVESGTGLWEATAGRVLDDAVRRALGSALEAARAATLVEVDRTDLEAITAETAAREDVRASLALAAAAVTVAQEEWVAATDVAATPSEGVTRPRSTSPAPSAPTGTDPVPAPEATPTPTPTPTPEPTPDPTPDPDPDPDPVDPPLGPPPWGAP